MLDWEWKRDPNVVAMFIHLLLTVNHEQGRWQGVVIEPGQKVTSLPNLAEEIGLTYQQTRTALFKLKSTGEITDKSTNKYRLITVNKWQEYQSDNSLERRQTTGKQQTTAQSSNSNIRNKEERSKEEYKNTGKPESSLDWLRSIPGEVVDGLAADYSVDSRFVQARANDVIDYCEAKGKRYANYKAALRNFIKAEIARHPEAIKRPEAKHIEIQERTPEEQARIDAKLATLKKQRELLASKLSN